MNDIQPTKEPKKKFKLHQPVFHPMNGTPEKSKPIMMLSLTPTSYMLQLL